MKIIKLSFIQLLIHLPMFQVLFCDGAKASCAAKIASSVDAAILGYHMYKNGQEFKSGDGLVMEMLKATIQSVGRLGREGMRETNKEIIKMMIHE